VQVIQINACARTVFALEELILPRATAEFLGRTEMKLGKSGTFD
jgi:hypothetical protein